MTAMEAAPLLCAGIIGYRCLRLVGIVGEGAGLAGRTARQPRETLDAVKERERWPDWPPPRPPEGGAGRLAIYGFGSAASLCTQVAIWRGWEVYGIARDEEHRAMARELGAVWAGQAGDDPGVLYDAAIVFAPAGELAVDALQRLDKGGIVALGGIYSSPIPAIEYPWIYHERVVRSVANSTRQDARELLRDAAAVPIVSRVQEYGLEQANEALLDLKEDRVRGSAVLRVGDG
jgi:propanol-preferring alcohol dehydrogenase